jgi:hypothetical protein
LIWGYAVYTSLGAALADDLGELVELIGSHLAHLADLFREDEVVAGLAEVLVVTPENCLESRCASLHNTRIDLFGSRLLLVCLDGLQVVSGPLANREEADWIVS